MRGRCSWGAGTGDTQGQHGLRRTGPQTGLSLSLPLEQEGKSGEGLRREPRLPTCPQLGTSISPLQGVRALKLAVDHDLAGGGGAGGHVAAATFLCSGGGATFLLV